VKIQEQAGGGGKMQSIRNEVSITVNKKFGTFQQVPNFN
jgi:hypothetical protein